MIKKLIFTGLLLGALTACELNSDDGQDCLMGEGALTSETRTISAGFSAILHQIPGTIHITQGSFPSLVVEGQPNLLPFLTNEINNDVLVLSFAECIDSGTPFNVFLTVTDLQAISLSGIGDVIFENDVECSHLELFLSGLGSYDIRGSADTLEITISGQGNVNGFDLISDRCDIIIAGTADVVEVTANQLLFVTINGQGNVFYKGMPTVLSDINGVGTVTDAN